ncbi:RecB family exonuclease [Demequina mangrovi]|uniref:Putative RecB family exonuclease n=1 Tax=Demequina mangrovi TaxID=1043493 RepID=A0A1H6TFX2_9MICO|nr:PD-(D/E)XK nuclease family protein [Demequina mangrovi]SEI78938.1 putative RecB family exonuclease [Demequina mangrovi]
MPRPPALSPSRAGDFQQCPLMFRYRVVDRLPEPPSPAATLGTLVHAVLEQLYDLPALERTVEAARARLEPGWRAMIAKDAALAELHEDEAAEQAWLAEGRQRLATYFDLENPQRLEPAAREEFIELQLEDGPLLRGIVDRIDIAPDGAIRIVDYKTGKTPDPRWGEKKERFQMRFYALVIERLRQRRPALLQLLFLKDGGRLEIRPSGDDIAQIEFEIREIWNQITAAAESGRFRTRKSKLCGWCSFQEVCPEFGGAERPLDPDAVERALGVRPVTA